MGRPAGPTRVTLQHLKQPWHVLVRFGARATRVRRCASVPPRTA
ncbi:hypothetical protein ACGFIR_13250 [Micromonospora sp. NPDC049051]